MVKISFNWQFYSSFFYGQEYLIFKYGYGPTATLFQQPYRVYTQEGKTREIN